MELIDTLNPLCTAHSRSIDHDTVVHRIDEDGTQRWYQNGLLHRLDGPAVIRQDGTQRWYLNGQRHRLDGPAVIYAGSHFWCQNDRYHRTDGPAVIWPNGEGEWFLNGKRYSFDQWLNSIDVTDKERTFLALKWN